MESWRASQLSSRAGLGSGLVDLVGTWSVLERRERRHARSRARTSPSPVIVGSALSSLSVGHNVGRGGGGELLMLLMLDIIVVIRYFYFSPVSLSFSPQALIFLSAVIGANGQGLTCETPKDCEVGESERMSSTRVSQ